MRKFSTILAAVLVAALAAAVCGYVHFERMIPQLSAWIIYTEATLLAKLSMTLSGLAVMVVAILTGVSALQRRSQGLGGVHLVALLVGLCTLAAAILAAMMGNLAIQRAIAMTGTTDPQATAPGYAEVMLVLVMGLLAPAIASLGRTWLPGRPAQT